MITKREELQNWNLSLLENLNKETGVKIWRMHQKHC